MCGIQCRSCHKFLPSDEFLKREDGKGLYAFCKKCMKEQTREPGWPPQEERGYGRLVRNWELD